MECGGILDLHGYSMRYDTKSPMIGSVRNYLAGYANDIDIVRESKVHIRAFEPADEDGMQKNCWLQGHPNRYELSRSRRT